MDQVFTAGIHRHRHDVPAELLEVFDLAEQGVALIFESVCRQELLEAELCQPLLVVVAGFKLEKWLGVGVSFAMNFLVLKQGREFYLPARMPVLR